MAAKTLQKLKSGTIVLPVRITREQDFYLRGFVQKGMFSSRQEAIRFFISEKMIRTARIEQFPEL